MEKFELSNQELDFCTICRYDLIEIISSLHCRRDLLQNEVSKFLSKKAFSSANEIRSRIDYLDNLIVKLDNLL